jgi:hypothetical protein
MNTFKWKWFISSKGRLEMQACSERRERAGWQVFCTFPGYMVLAYSFINGIGAFKRSK